MIESALKRTCVVLGSELKDVLQSDCFVDKSLIIKDFLNIKSRFFRVTAPRGFGKTVNLQMLKAFLQADNGLITLNQTVKHNLNIFKLYNTLFNLNCGKYPVLFITFKELRGNSYKNILRAFREIIYESFLQHKYLKTSTRLKDTDKYRLSLVNKNIMENLTAVTLKKGLVYLSKMLYVHFQKKVIILIDDMNTPVCTQMCIRDRFYAIELVYSTISSNQSPYL